MADEIMTFDEILADPIYKAEFDRRITKALSTVQSKLDAEVEKNKQFAANGSAETEALKRKTLQTFNAGIFWAQDCRAGQTVNIFQVITRKHQVFNLLKSTAV